MSELNPNEVEIDRLLRTSMEAPIPTLSSNFDQHLMLEVQRTSVSNDRYRLAVLGGYGSISVLACTLIMHDQGLGWPAIAASILVPLAVVAMPRTFRRARTTA